MKVALLTSGGDAPGMNSVLVNLIHYMFDSGVQVSLVQDGFKGLLDNKFIDVCNKNEYDNFLTEAGSFIYCARSKEFVTNWPIAIDNLKKNNIDVLVVIGGDGSFKGTQLLSNSIPTLFIPATIDNDVEWSDYSVGFDSCLNEIINQSNKIIKTFKTHKNVVVVEVMGRYCSDLTNAAAKVIQPAIVLNHENKKPINQIVNELKDFYKQNNYGFILMSENLYSKDEIKELLSSIESNLNCAARFDSLGYSQRGANVTEYELSVTNKFAKLVSELVNNHIYNNAVSVNNHEVINISYESIKE